MANQLHPKPQRRRQGQSSENNAQEATDTGYQHRHDTDLPRKRLCAVVLSVRREASARMGDWSVTTTSTTYDLDTACFMGDATVRERDDGSTGR
jgi:hypothetical protein